MSDNERVELAVAAMSVYEIRALLQQKHAERAAIVEDLATLGMALAVMVRRGNPPGPRPSARQESTPAQKARARERSRLWREQRSRADPTYRERELARLREI